MEGPQTNKENISITQKLDETYWFGLTDEEIATFGRLPRTCSVNQKELRKNGIASKKMHAIYHDKR